MAGNNQRRLETDCIIQNVSMAFYEMMNVARRLMYVREEAAVLIQQGLFAEWVRINTRLEIERDEAGLVKWTS